MGIEVQNLRMKVESLSSRLDFSERRVRALEGVVQYRPEAVRAPERHDDGRRSRAGAAGVDRIGVEGFVPAGRRQPARQGDGQRTTPPAPAARTPRGTGRRVPGAAGAPGARVRQVHRCAGCGRRQGRRSRRIDDPDDGDEFENGDEMTDARRTDSRRRRLERRDFDASDALRRAPGTRCTRCTRGTCRHPSTRSDDDSSEGRGRRSAVRRRHQRRRRTACALRRRAPGARTSRSRC